MSALRMFFAGLRSFSDEALNDLKKVIKAWRALKPLQAAGLLSGYFQRSPKVFSR